MRDLMPLISRDPDLELYREMNGEFEGYLHRWCLIPRNKQRNVYIHRILSADENMLHDHPWDFESIILSGGYLEQTESGTERHKKGDRFHRKAADLHRIVSVQPDTWTLVITGPVVRNWGFMIDGAWCHYDDPMAKVREVKSIARNGYFDGDDT